VLLLGLALAWPAGAEEPAPTPAATPAPAPAPAPTQAKDAVEKLGLRFTPDAELVITSDEAEGVKRTSGEESVVFTKHVRAKQGDMNLECDWLEAIYPQTAGGRPDKISAKGSVVITQGTNQARCSEALVDNVACTAECRSTGGRALLRRGTDDVEANAIYFDLCKGTVRAVGEVVIRVREKPGETPDHGPAQTPDKGPAQTPAGADGAQPPGASGE
jgi:lipopolysaccharide export system protein LptA